jgi:hypothetical protein
VDKNQKKTEKEKQFLIDGPPAFIQSVEMVLSELKQKNPFRYDEALTYLPRAIYDPALNFSYPGRHHWQGLSNGHFGYDGTNAKYKSFRFIFLHEVGHCVHKKQKKINTEATANAYAHMVLREMGLK